MNYSSSSSMSARLFLVPSKPSVRRLVAVNALDATLSTVLVSGSSMNWLFVHKNFPSQYVHVARYLAAAGHRVVFITQQRGLALRGVEKIEYRAPPLGGRPHPYLRCLTRAVANGQAVAAIGERLKKEGFTPDLVAGHPGWGEILFLKEVWPRVPLLGYFEFFYRAVGSDLDFDPEFPPEADDPMRVRAMNAVNLLALDAVDWGQTPTRYQHSIYPAIYRPRITVVHDGVDTGRLRPDNGACVTLSDGTVLSRSDEIVTYCARGLEPYRGFHVFMRSLPLVQRQRPNAHIVLIGGDRASYGRDPQGHGSYREQLLTELGAELDLPQSPLSWECPLRSLSAHPASIVSARLSDVSLGAVVVVHRGDGDGMPRHWIEHAAGRRGHH